MSTSTAHKEITPGPKRLVVSHFHDLKEKLYSYNMNPFATGPARNISTGAKIDSKVIEGLLKSPKIGDKKYKEFVTEILVKGTVNFYDPIKKVMLDTGL